MHLAEAWRVLGVEPTEEPAEIRRAYLRRLVLVHPDRSDRSDATDATIELRSAYERVIESLGAPDALAVSDRAEGPQRDGTDGSAGARPGPPPVVVEQVADDTVAVHAPADETAALLVDVAHRLGEIAFIDLHAPLIQVIVEFVDEPVCQLLMTLQGRATGITEVFLSIEAIGGGTAPPIESVTRLVCEMVATAG